MMFRSGLIDIFSRGTGIIYNLILAAITVYFFTYIGGVEMEAKAGR